MLVIGINFEHGITFSRTLPNTNVYDPQIIADYLRIDMNGEIDEILVVEADMVQCQFSLAEEDYI